jgi:DNA-binding CsgD family transcriptional regulator
MKISIQLSKREKEVVELLKDGFSNKEIALRLNISHHTISAYLRSVYKKFRVENRTQAVLRFLELNSTLPKTG